jgi:hypothetical protein
VILHILLLHKGSLSTNLSSDFVVGQTGSREKRDLLASSD